VAYQVKLEVFEGPFDLLLHLISRREIDIYDVSVAEITDEYLAYIETLRELDLEVATEFLLIAATLLKLKSDYLLPEPEQEIEEASASEMREELLWRLVEYQKFRNAGAELTTRLEREDRNYYRQVDLEEPFRDVMPDIIAGLTLEKLQEAAREIIDSEPEVDVSYIAPIKVSVSEFIERVRAVLEDRGQTSYRELTEELVYKAEFIATFLALLELYKREEIDMRQVGRFGDIKVYPKREVEDGD
jgi:segregation and condensation protein A